ncbi:hypothetical protein B0H16DRAFT_1470347 [Mycena metata]|uniref:Uncharacterized protein n=1 Tax=Mycena metata TaxID=1033252 RepID=A0AAD7MQP9_9AGAR|nr:hypothetical protein B0H16DRAFT_1470347 [Mycena metata]
MRPWLWTEEQEEGMGLNGRRNETHLIPRRLPTLSENTVVLCGKKGRGSGREEMRWEVRNPRKQKLLDEIHAGRKTRGVATSATTTNERKDQTTHRHPRPWNPITFRRNIFQPLGLYDIKDRRGTEVIKLELPSVIRFNRENVVSDALDVSEF